MELISKNNPKKLAHCLLIGIFEFAPPTGRVLGWTGLRAGMAEIVSALKTSSNLSGDRLLRFVDVGALAPWICIFGFSS
jgi:hypothetical protein